jgi:hypothetical protein
VPNTIAEARQLIQSRLADLDAEAEKLKRALASLGEGGGRTRRPGRPRKSAPGGAAPPKRKRATRKRKAARAPRGQRREQLLAAIKASPGARPSELAKAIGVKPTQIHALIAKARAEKVIVKKDNGYALKSWGRNAARRRWLPKSGGVSRLALLVIGVVVQISVTIF